MGDFKIKEYFRDRWIKRRIGIVEIRNVGKVEEIFATKEEGIYIYDKLVIFFLFFYEKFY